MARHEFVPTWMASLIVVFSLTTAAAIVVFIAGHVQRAAVVERWTPLKDEVQALRQVEADLAESIPPIETQIVYARETLDRFALGDTTEQSDIDTELDAIDRVFDAPEGDPSTVPGIRIRSETHLESYRQAYQAMLRARDELAAEEQRELENERTAEVGLVELREQKEERRVELTRQRREQRREERVVELRIAELEARVAELEDRQDNAQNELVSDGQVLQARVTAGFVIINRGLDQDLRSGTRFQVYNRVGGRNMLKGEIEVVRVEQRQSLARVLTEITADHPIIPGDHLHNPIYNPEETKIFVIKGEFARFNHPELASFIQEVGGVVDREISTRSHYLVAGENAAEAIEAARLYGVTILSEDQLLDFVRREERFLVRGGMVFAVVGEFNQVPRGQITDWVDANGGVVVDQMQEGVNVLVAGENAAEAISQARLSGVTIVNQRELLSLMTNHNGGVVP